MKTAVYVCDCGSNIAGQIDADGLVAGLGRLEGVCSVQRHEFLCSEEGKQFLAGDLRKDKPERVVIAACSPRDYESTFRNVLGGAGMNPYLMQMVNIREQVAWMTPDKAEATGKAFRQIRAAVKRAGRQEPLEAVRLDVRPEVMVIGAGPAGLKAALSLAQAGRRVTLVERTAYLGGMPVLYEDVFPKMECAPCMLEPVLGDVLHGPHADRIEVLLLSEVTDLAGFYGNFTVKIRQAPRYVDLAKCIGCGMCVPPCPASGPNRSNAGLNEKKAIDYSFAGGLPNAPFLDDSLCVRGRGEDCRLCLDECPVEGAVVLDDRERLLERNVGAIVAAVGFGLDAPEELGRDRIPGLYSSFEFERLLSASGPTGGDLRTPGGAAPSSIAIVHCAGSLDGGERNYCSRVCCGSALKFNHMLRERLPEATIHHLYKELVLPGKDDFEMYREARESAGSRFLRCAESSKVAVSRTGEHNTVQYQDAAGRAQSLEADLVVLCTAMTPAAGSAKLAETLGVPLDRHGFFEELHGRLDSTESKLKGIYLAGACQSPSDIQESMRQGMAAAGYILSGLIEGKQLTLDPAVAEVDPERCSGCRTCRFVCPYKAIGVAADGVKAEISGLLCHGCGTCVAACPAGAITGRHFTAGQVSAEIEAILQ